MTPLYEPSLLLSEQYFMLNNVISSYYIQVRSNDDWSKHLSTYFLFKDVTVLSTIRL